MYSLQESEIIGTRDDASTVTNISKPHSTIPNNQSINNTVIAVLVEPPPVAGKPHVLNPGHIFTRDNTFNVKVSGPIRVSIEDFELNVWHGLPFAKIVGVELEFRAHDTGTEYQENKFAKIMAIDPDFSRNNKDIYDHGFESTVRVPIKTAILVVRKDRMPLDSKVIEAIWDFAGQPELRTITNLAEGTNSGNMVRWGSVIALRRNWSKINEEGGFISWWYEWKDSKVKGNFPGYDGLECPAESARHISAAKKGKNPGIRCALQ